MIDRKIIERAARELGAAKLGIGDLSLFAGEDPRRDPKMVCPKAKCLIGFGIPVPKGLYKTMKDGSQFYTYTTLGVKAIDEEYFEIFLFKMASLIEDAGYDACLQRTTPNLKVKGDKTCNPETVGIYELKYASPVEAAAGRHPGFRKGGARLRPWLAGAERTDRQPGVRPLHALCVHHHGR